MTSIDEYQILKSRSEEFLDSAEYQLDKGYFTVAASSFHRSLELFLKSVLLIHGVEYPRTHSLKSLIEIIANATEEKCSVTAKGIAEHIHYGTSIAGRCVHHFQILFKRVLKGGDH